MMKLHLTLNYHVMNDGRSEWHPILAVMAILSCAERVEFALLVAQFRSDIRAYPVFNGVRDFVCQFEMLQHEARTGMKTIRVCIGHYIDYLLRGINTLTPEVSESIPGTR
jgi:hypothetical protein